MFIITLFYQQTNHTKKHNKINVIEILYIEFILFCPQSYSHFVDNFIKNFQQFYILYNLWKNIKKLSVCRLCIFYKKIKKNTKFFLLSYIYIFLFYECSIEHCNYLISNQKIIKNQLTFIQKVFIILLLCLQLRL